MRNPRSSQIRNATKYKGHTIYNPAKSSSAKEASGSWNISYGDGSSASGNVYSETVTLGDLAIPGQAVELAKKLSASFLQDSGNDGLLGLAWPSINTVYPRPVATPVENLINKKLIDPVRLYMWWGCVCADCRLTTRIYPARLHRQARAW